MEDTDLKWRTASYSSNGEPVRAGRRGGRAGNAAHSARTRGRCAVQALYRT